MQTTKAQSTRHIEQPSGTSSVSDFSLSQYPLQELSSQTNLTYHPNVIKFLLWCILLVLCWPVALLALIVYPIVWLILIPFRLLGVVVSGLLDLIWAVVTLPVLVLRKLAHQ